MAAADHYFATNTQDALSTATILTWQESNKTVMSISRKVIDASTPWQKVCTGDPQPLLGFRLTRRGRRSSIPIEQREQSRKLKKQNMERRRRACISDKMTALHKLAMTLLGEDSPLSLPDTLQPSHYQKFEKADLLNLCYTVFESVVHLVKQQPDIHQRVQALTEQVRAQFSMANDYHTHQVACDNHQFTADEVDTSRIGTLVASHQQPIVLQPHHPTPGQDWQHDPLAPGDHCSTTCSQTRPLQPPNRESPSPAWEVGNQSPDGQDLPAQQQSLSVPAALPKQTRSPAKTTPSTRDTGSSVRRGHQEGIAQSAAVDPCPSFGNKTTTSHGDQTPSVCQLQPETDSRADHVWRPYLE